MATLVVGTISWLTYRSAGTLITATLSVGTHITTNISVDTLIKAHLSVGTLITANLSVSHYRIYECIF